mgnify:FL=1
MYFRDNVGPMIACVVGAIFIFTVSPTQALLSLLLYQVIQLIEGNLIYPRVVGQSIGLPAIFTLAAASIGGNLFGLLGMIFLHRYLLLSIDWLRNLSLQRKIR